MKKALIERIWAPGMQAIFESDQGTNHSSSGSSLGIRYHLCASKAWLRLFGCDNGCFHPMRS